MPVSFEGEEYVASMQVAKIGFLGSYVELENSRDGKFRLLSLLLVSNTPHAGGKESTRRDIVFAPDTGDKQKAIKNLVALKR